MAQGHEYNEYYDNDAFDDTESHHDMEDVDARDFTLEQVFMLDGQDECVKPEFDMDSNLLQEGNPFEDQDPDSEEYDKYEGSLIHYFRRSVRISIKF